MGPGRQETRMKQMTNVMCQKIMTFAEKNIYLLLVKWYKHILVDIIILRLD